MSFFYYIINLFLFKINKVKYKTFRIRGICIILNKGTFIVGSYLRINSSPFVNVIGGMTRSTFVVKPSASLIIGNSVSISNSSFYCANKIVIEDNVMIGGSCKIWDTDFHPLDPHLRKISPNDGYVTKPIYIQNSVFIGGGSIILKGVTIGENSVVGAGSVVSKNIPANEVWAGNPARFIRKL